MTREEYLKELNKAFGDFKFYEENHTYTYKDKPISIGATSLIEQYTQDFDVQAVAERVAEKQVLYRSSVNLQGGHQICG